MNELHLTSHQKISKKLPYCHLKKRRCFQPLLGSFPPHFFKSLNLLFLTRPTKRNVVIINLFMEVNGWANIFHRIKGWCGTNPTFFFFFFFWDSIMWGPNHDSVHLEGHVGIFAFKQLVRRENVGLNVVYDLRRHITMIVFIFLLAKKLKGKGRKFTSLL